VQHGYNPPVAGKEGKDKQGAGATPTIVNRKAFHDYSIEDELECGIVLKGFEVKVVRQGNFQLRDSYVELAKDGELWLVGSHIPSYPQAGNWEPYDPDRRRKLLAHAGEIKKLRRKVIEKGFTVIPLRVYFSHGKVKVLIALARGKKQYDKRDTIKQRDVQRDAERGRVKVKG
jgi:SsrA-binding protein